MHDMRRNNPNLGSHLFVQYSHLFVYCNDRRVQNSIILWLKIVVNPHENGSISPSWFCAIVLAHSFEPLNPLWKILRNK